MDQLREQVARARRRLVLEQFLGRLVLSLLAVFTLAAIAVAVPRVIAIEGLPANWDFGWLVGALAGGFLAAAVWTALTARTPLDAAIEIDRRFGLRERVASSLSLSPEEQSSDVGRAVVDDAVRAVRRIEIDEKFRVQLGRRAWWPLVPAALVFALVTFVNYREAASGPDPQAAVNLEQQIKQSAESLRKKIEEQRKLAEERDLRAAEDLFKQIEQGTRDLEAKQKIDRTKAHAALNDLAKQLEERREQLGGKDALKQQFQNMKNLGAGPAEKAAQAMRQGDWKKALEEIEKLAKDMQAGKLDDAAKEQLAKQLGQMKERLEAAAQAHQQAMDDLKKQIDRLREQGDLAKAGELQQKLDQLQRQKPQMDRLQQLAQQLAECQQCLQDGDGQQAANALAQMAQQLDKLQMDANELAMLDAALEELDMAKLAMACDECMGAGCEGCQGGFGDGMGFGDNFDGEPGMGLGEGIGIGPRPEERNPTNLRDTQVRQKQQRGAAVFGGMVEGPNIKGDVTQSIQEEMATLAAEPADPLASERLPTSRRQHAEQYFQMLREGR